MQAPPDFYQRKIYYALIIASVIYFFLSSVVIVVVLFHFSATLHNFTCGFWSRCFSPCTGCVWMCVVCAECRIARPSLHLCLAHCFPDAKSVRLKFVVRIVPRARFTYSIFYLIIANVAHCHRSHTFWLDVMRVSLFASLLRPNAKYRVLRAPPMHTQTHTAERWNKKSIELFIRFNRMWISIDPSACVCAIAFDWIPV